MKKTLILSIILSAAVLGVMYVNRTDFPSKKAAWDIDANEEAYYNIKKQGKRPFLKRIPNQSFFQQRAYPYDEIPRERYFAAMTDVQARRKLFHSSAATGRQLSWAAAGPTNIPGRLAALAVHPSDTNTIYIGNAGGGIFKTTDHGASWTSIFDDVGTFPVGAIAIDPADPNTIYVGTGEPNVRIDSYEGTGMYKSTDAGATWTHIGLPNSARIGRIVVDPLRPDTVFVAVLGKEFGGVASSDRGVYRSEDGGLNWTQVLFIDTQTGCIDLAYHPDSGVVIAAMYGNVTWRGVLWKGVHNNAIWRSTDNGTTWSIVSGVGGLPTPGNYGRTGLTLDPQSTTVYAFISGQSSENIMGIYRSDNLGANWFLVSSPPQSTISGRGWYFGNIRVAPGNPQTVYFLGITLWKSTNGGSSWFGVSGITHADHHDMYIMEGNPNRVYLGTDGGLYITTNGASSWTAYQNMGNTQFYELTMNYQLPDHVLGGTQDNGTLRTLTGSTGDWTRIFGGDGFVSIVDYTDPNIIYVEWQWGNLQKSTDGGFNFSLVTNGIPPRNIETRAWNTPVVLDPINPTVLYYGNTRVYRSTDRADNWSPISPTLTTWYLTSVAAARSDSQVIYAGARTGEISVTTNGGASWTSITSGLPGRWITEITIDPIDAAIAYVSLSGYIDNGETLPRVFRTTDFGSNWTSIMGDLPDAPINDIILDPHDRNIWYVANDVGVYTSDDGGTSWQDLAMGLPIVLVHDIDIHPRSRKMVAATHGRSMFETTLPCPGITDTDLDGIPDSCDNCPDIPNPGQEDADGDLIADECDECTDPDGDGFGSPGFAANTCPEDNCPDVYNPDQLDLDSNGVGDACELVTNPPATDTIATTCTQLIVNSDGRWGLNGTSGVTLDYLGGGDCSGIYTFDGSIVVARTVNGSAVVDHAFFGASSFKRPFDGDPSEPTTNFGDFELFKTGTFTTNEGAIGLEIEWYAPQQTDSCNFVIQYFKAYSLDGLEHDSVTLGMAVDWDIPSSAGANNTAGVDAANGLVYQVGVGTGCVNNTTRFGGQALIGFSINDACTDTTVKAYGGYTAQNAIDIFPTGNFVPAVLLSKMSIAGFTFDGSNSDQHAVLTFVHNQTIGTGDTLRMYSVISTVRNGSLAELIDNIAKARQWLVDHVATVCPPPCCVGNRGDANGDGIDANILDLVHLVDFIFRGGPLSDCPEESDMNGDGTPSNILDLTFLVDFIFRGGTAPGPCP
ncbi:MAG: hypothetical protein IIA17_04465 [candidate division Zixibacteria bacterium]|nr:hypothetical protein [candidate division Zixibacteria bacterium]